MSIYVFTKAVVAKADKTIAYFHHASMRPIDLYLASFLARLD